MSTVPKASGPSCWLVILPRILQLCTLRPTEAKELDQGHKACGRQGCFESRAVSASVKFSKLSALLSKWSLASFWIKRILISGSRRSGKEVPGPDMLFEKVSQLCCVLLDICYEAHSRNLQRSQKISRTRFPFYVWELGTSRIGQFHHHCQLTQLSPVTSLAAISKKSE